MRNPIDVLKLLTEKASVKGYQFERLYRNLYNPDFYLLAYKNIATSPESMTAGADGMTIDNMSMACINRIISALKDQTYQPKEYEKISRRYRKTKKKLDAGNPSKEDVLEFKAAQKLKLSTPYVDVLDSRWEGVSLRSPRKVGKQAA